MNPLNFFILIPLQISLVSFFVGYFIVLFSFVEFGSRVFDIYSATSNNFCESLATEINSY